MKTLSRQKALTYFKTYFKLSQPTEKGWYRFSDPFDDHDDNSAGVNFHYDKVRGFRSGFVGTISDFIEKYEQVDNSEILLRNLEPEDYAQANEAREINTDEIAQWPKYFMPLDHYNKRMHNYLMRRGFDYEELKEIGFGYCLRGDYAYRLIIPFFINSELKYWQGRTVLSNCEPKYLNPPANYCPLTKNMLWYNQDALKYNDKIYITEGWSDAQMFEGGVSTQGWKISLMQYGILMKHKKSVRDITVIADRGWYGKQVEQWLPFCDEFNIKIINLDDQQGKDANELGTDIILKLEEKANYLSMLNLVEIL